MSDARLHGRMHAFDYSVNQTGLSRGPRTGTARNIATILLLVLFAAAIALVVSAIVACMTYAPAALSDVVEGPTPPSNMNFADG